VSRGRLAKLIGQAPEHVKPLLRGARDHGVGLVWLLQHAEAVDIARMLTKRPMGGATSSCSCWKPVDDQF